MAAAPNLRPVSAFFRGRHELGITASLSGVGTVGLKAMRERRRARKTAVYIITAGEALEARQHAILVSVPQTLALGRQ